MKHCVYSALIFALLLASPVQAQLPAAQWAAQQTNELAAINDKNLADLLKQGKSTLEKLFAEIKTGGETDPVACTRIAALTQFVMRPAGAASRKDYADALLAATRRAAEADVACFFLDQLRWCGLPHQADAIKAFEKSAAPGVAALATMTVQAVTDDCAPKAAPVAETRCAALNRELAALKPKALTPRLLQAFDDTDAAFAGVALVWARSAGGKKETALWVGKLAAATDPVRTVMLLDMLAARGDKAACKPVAALASHADTGVAAAAQQALIRLDPAAYADQLPLLLKDLTPERSALVRDAARLLTTKSLTPPLLKAYDTFSDSGKKIAMDLFKERHVTEASRFALATLDAKDEETVISGYRLLRETAGAEHADTLIAKLLSSAGRVTPEVQSAVAAAARRDASGTYVKALIRALQTAPATARPAALETASRIGGQSLLQTVEAACADANAEISAAAIRALAVWPDASALPALLRLAVAAPDSKRQVLAARGVAKLFAADGFDKQSCLSLWRTIRTQPGDDTRKKEIDALFAEEINVALGKPVTTNVPQQGEYAPCFLVDGTLEKAWHGAKWPAQAQIDLGSVTPLHAAHVNFYHGGRTYTFTLELSEDGQVWKQVAGNSDAPKPATAEGLRLNFTATPARYMRLNVVKNSVNEAVHVLELKVFQAVFK